MLLLFGERLVKNINRENLLTIRNAILFACTIGCVFVIYTILKGDKDVEDSK